MTGRPIPAKPRIPVNPMNITVNAGKSPARKLTSKPTQGTTELGMISEDGQGASPDSKSPSPKKKGYGMMQRLTTEEWNEQKDKA